MHDSDVLFKNIISTLRYCVLFFSGESLVVSSVSEREVCVTGR